MSFGVDRAGEGGYGPWGRVALRMELEMGEVVFS